MTDRSDVTGIWRRLRRGWGPEGDVWGPAHFVPDNRNPATGAWRGRGIEAVCGVGTYRTRLALVQDTIEQPSEHLCRDCLPPPTAGSGQEDDHA